MVAKLEWHREEIIPRVGFIVSNLSRSPKNTMRFYNQRGNCERFIKEGKYALSWTRLSCSRFISNQVRLALFVLAYNLGNFLRRFALPKEVSTWSLRSIQLKLVKIGARVISHSRRTVFQLAEMAVSEAVVCEDIGPHPRIAICAHLKPSFSQELTRTSILAAVEACRNQAKRSLTGRLLNNQGKERRIGGAKYNRAPWLW